MLTKTGLSDTVESNSSPANFDREGGFEIIGHRAKLDPRHHFQAQPRQPTQPHTNKRQTPALSLFVTEPILSVAPCPSQTTAVPPSACISAAFFSSSLTVPPIPTPPPFSRPVSNSSHSYTAFLELSNTERQVRNKSLLYPNLRSGHRRRLAILLRGDSQISDLLLLHIPSRVGLPRTCPSPAKILLSDKTRGANRCATILPGSAPLALSCNSFARNSIPLILPDFPPKDYPGSVFPAPGFSIVFRIPEAPHVTIRGQGSLRQSCTLRLRAPHRK